MGSQVGRHLGRPSDNPTLEVLQVTKGSGSMEPDHEQIRVGFGHWTVARALQVRGQPRGGRLWRPLPSHRVRGIDL